MAGFVIPPGEKGIERRRRLADVLAQQGSSTAPVQSWTQGAARVAQSLASVLGNYQANQMEGQRNSALAEALRSGTADQLMMSMDPDLQRVGIYKAQQAQEAAAAQRQADNDARNRTRDTISDEHWAQNFARQAAQQAESNARADAAAARADAAAAKPQIRTILNADGSQSLVSVDQNGNVAPLPLPGQGAQANPDAAIPVPKLTEGEQKSFRFYRRARNANDALSPAEEEALASGMQNTVGWTQGALEKVPYVGEGLAGAANAAHSDAYQNAKIHADRIIASLNYSDSGAQINKDEYSRQWNSLIPVFGNGPDAIAAKRKARADALSSLKATVGRGVPTLDREEKAYAEAAAAAKAGVPQDQINQRLKENGFDPPGAE